MGIIETMHRWLDHFSIEELDSVISHLIRIKECEADPRPNKTFFGKLNEADYHRLKLHYRIEYFAGNQDRNATLNNLVEILDETYSRLQPTVQHGASIQRGKK
tara:strand:+ start:254 stop:562 length:309 start_codon:yes stop_codon:yes gene_type:complete